MTMTRSTGRLLLTAAVLASLALGLTACGKKGSPRPPEGEEADYTYPDQYPAPNTVTPNSKGETPNSGPFSIFTNDTRTKTTTY